MNFFTCMPCPDWGDISTIVVGIMNVIVGIVSIRVMRSQRDIADKATALQKREHQPVFKVKMTQYKSEGSDVYDLMDYALVNVGEKVKSYRDVSVNTYLKLSLIQFHPSLIVYGPIYASINGYFGWFTNVNELQGLVYKSRETKWCANNKWFGELYHQAIAYGKNHPDWHMYVDLVHLTNVSYIDIYDEVHTCYFVNEAEVDAKAYNEVKTASSKNFSVSYILNVGN